MCVCVTLWRVCVCVCVCVCVAGGGRSVQVFLADGLVWTSANEQYCWKHALIIISLTLTFRHTAPPSL